MQDKVQPFPSNLQDKLHITSKTFFSCSLVIIICSLVLRIFCIGMNDLIVEEAYYWNYAKHLDFGYLDHPPMVATLIWLSTHLFGSEEIFVRISSFFCWILTSVFVYKLTNLVKMGAGIYSVMLLSILPFFFVHSLVITPDMPLTACWAGALYFLYRALVLNESKGWYWAGVWLGLGMLSKYTIVLLGPGVFVYLLLDRAKRHWFIRKEPYLCLLISCVIFSPVIYWNASNDWASFAFQSTRRFKSVISFSLHQYLGLLLLFLLPPGILGFFQFLQNKKNYLINDISAVSRYFFLVFTLVPLLFFGIFSLRHGIKFNWIGPGLLALIPVLAIMMSRPGKSRSRLQLYWLSNAIIVLAIYGFMMGAIGFGNHDIVNKKLFKKFISWRGLTEEFYSVAREVELKTSTTPIFVPLDAYNISSELSYYQSKLLKEGVIGKVYPIEGCQIFGGESLMYKYWSKNQSLIGKTLLLVSAERRDFDNQAVLSRVIKKSPVLQVWSHNQSENSKIIPYYYQEVQLKS